MAEEDKETEETEETEEISENTIKENAIKRVSGKLTKIFKKISLPKLSKKAIIIIAVSSVLLIILIVTSLFFIFKSSSKDDINNIALNEELTTTEAREQDTVGSDIVGLNIVGSDIVFENIVDLEPFERIALKTGSTMKFVTINLSLELTDQRYRKQIITMEERIRKIITDQVNRMAWFELRSPEGKIMLKYNLIKQINSIFPKLPIRNIYFTYFIMQ